MTGQPRVTRRIAFQGLGALGVAAALAGCAGSGSNGAGGAGGDAPKTAKGAELASTGDVPVGGGLVLTEEKIVLTQPTEGEFKAFTAVCTHQGFLVGTVANDVITCEHHGSKFSAVDGKVEMGPASSPLKSVPITVDGDKIVAA